MKPALSLALCMSVIAVTACSPLRAQGWLAIRLLTAHR